MSLEDAWNQAPKFPTGGVPRLATVDSVPVKAIVPGTLDLNRTTLGAQFPPDYYESKPIDLSTVIKGWQDKVVEKFPQKETRSHSHYFKDVSMFKEIDVYIVLKLFNVTDPAIQHAAKKLLVAGGRGAGKDMSKDIQEAIDSLKRYQEIERQINPKGDGDTTK